MYFFNLRGKNMFGCAHKMFKCLHKEEFLGFSTCDNGLAYKISTRGFFTRRILSVREAGFVSKGGGAACQYRLQKKLASVIFACRTFGSF